jgi:hypothetical protein
MARVKLSYLASLYLFSQLPVAGDAAGKSSESRESLFADHNLRHDLS